MTRTIILRILGLTTAAALAATATSLVAHGLERSVPWLSDALQSFETWARKPPPEGAAVLAGTGLLIVAIAVVTVYAGRRVRGVKTIEKSPTGRTNVDMGSVAEAVELSLGTVDPNTHVSARRSKLRVVAPAGAADRFETADQASRMTGETLEQMGLADTPFTVALGRSAEKRVT
jgi:hypothetical protein